MDGNDASPGRLRVQADTELVMVELLDTKPSCRNFNHFVKGILAHTPHHCWKNALIDGRETVSKEWWNVPVELLTTMSVSWVHHHGNSGRKASEGVAVYSMLSRMAQGMNFVRPSSNP